MSLKQKYEKSMAEKRCLRFTIENPDGDIYDGIVTHVKPTFIVMREETDFELDGVIVLPKRSIKRCRDDKHDECCNQILGQNGALKKLRRIRWLDSCDTIPKVIVAMMHRDIWPCIETLTERKDESIFYVGPITKAGDEQFSLKCYDAAGRWEKEYELSYDDNLPN